MRYSVGRCYEPTWECTDMTPDQELLEGLKLAAGAGLSMALLALVLGVRAVLGG